MELGPSSFFELRVQIRTRPDIDRDLPGLQLSCGPYFSYLEAVTVMMEGLDIILARYRSDLTGPLMVSTQLLECLWSRSTIEVIDVKAEDQQEM